MRTEYIGTDVKEDSIPKTYQDEFFFYGCFFDGHWLTELNCKQITFVGCYFAGEAEISQTTFEKILFKNCFFCKPLEIHISSQISHWEDVIDIHDDSDSHITIYQNNERIAEKIINVLPRQFKDFVSLRHFDADLVYEQLKGIYNYYIDQKNIDCIPIFSGLITEACDVVQRDTIQYLLDHGTSSIWHKQIMQVVFNWTFDQYVIPDISFVSKVKPSDKWHVPSFSRIFSDNWFDIIDGLKSVLRCLKHNPALLEEPFYNRIKYLALYSEVISEVGRCIAIIAIKDHDFLKVVIEKRSELIQKFKDPDVLALIEMLNKSSK